ncbi:ImuA family protein [Erythrobacter sp. JK5]|uniref:ImuA family protein n=1 Tax=Erythrobacter sp. JK5 TaxID=2829500 RepID=UPI0020122E38|nr:recA-like protein [Erythrobacter sp. JK5]
MPKSVSSSGAKALHNFPVPSRPRPGGSARLSASDIAALSQAREARWRPGLTDQPLHSEIFASTGDASGAGVALALARDALRVAEAVEDPLTEAEDRRQVLWVQESRAIARSGRPYHHGLPRELRHRLIHVEAKTPEDALFALEEGLRCRDLACVIGEIVGNPRALDFTASRRLSLAAEKHGVPLWLVRLEAEADLSSARMRWRIEAAPSTRPRWNADAPGAPAWQAELFRARSHAPGKWILSNDDGRLSARKSPPRSAANAATPDSRDLVRATVGRSLAACARA